MQRNSVQSELMYNWFIGIIFSLIHICLGAVDINLSLFGISSTCLKSKRVSSVCSQCLFMALSQFFIGLVVICVNLNYRVRIFTIIVIAQGYDIFMGCLSTRRIFGLNCFRRFCGCPLEFFIIDSAVITIVRVAAPIIK